ncbi:Inhibitor of apoptosis-promoting Bax1-related protein [Coemansia thaxteri]|uniref:Inhibitor of apoptosis-promoting Bax1-related protein n=1 Tax=Coemansia thaxteri TaxID=2663907 RepID=A0A9W8EMF4_9FUNG|nr:Inhibitor of apoptosis-promoting Bax1-related protein [Coemansia thaxteri]
MLASTLAASMLGYYATGQIYMLRNHSLLFAVGILGLALAIFFIPATPQNLPKRRVLLWTLGGLVGSVVRPSIRMRMLYGDADLVFMAAGMSVALFASFSVGTMMSSRSQVIYAIGSASMALSAIGWICLASLFYPSAAAISMNLVYGLAVACLYVVVHTHKVLEKAVRGEELDPVVHALRFFGDMGDLFFTLLDLFQNDRRSRERSEDDQGRPRHANRGGRRRYAPAAGTSFEFNRC